MKISFTESDMVFLFSDENKLFRIEKSELYQKLGQGICCTEFVSIYRKNELSFVEAKQTCPNVNTKDESKEKTKKYEEFYTQLSRKFTDTLMMMAAAQMGRLNSKEMGSDLRNIQAWDNLKLIFLLIVKNSEEAWLGGIKAELERRLLDIRKIWRIEIRVLNEEMARCKGVVI